MITVIFLKLVSYVHFWYDVRKFIDERKRLIKEETASARNVYKEIEEVIDNYPNNQVLSNLIEFLFMPVLCYQYKYPRTERVRKRNVILYLVQFCLCSTFSM